MTWSHKGGVGLQRYSFLTSAQDGVGGQIDLLFTLPPEKIQCLLYRRLGDPQRVGLDGPRNSRPHRGLIPGPSNVASPYTDRAMPEHWRNGAERVERSTCSRNFSTILCHPEIAQGLARYLHLTSRWKYLCKSASSHSYKTFWDTNFLFISDPFLAERPKNNGDLYTEKKRPGVIEKWRKNTLSFEVFFNYVLYSKHSTESHSCCKV